MTTHVNTIELTDEELKALNEMARQSKVTATAEELLLIKLGRSSSPLLDCVFKVAVAYENRLAEINNPKPVVTEDAPLAEIEDTD